MSELLTIRTIRIAPDLVEFDGALTDYETSNPIASWAGNALRFEICIMDGGEPIDASQIASVRISAKATKTLAASYVLNKTTTSITLGVTQAAWLAGTAQQAVIEFTDAEMELDLDGGDSREFFLTVTAVTSGGNEITCEAGAFVLHEDYNSTGDPAPEAEDDYLTIEDGMALFQTANSAVGPSANRPTLADGEDIGFRYFDTTLGHPIWWDGAAWINATGSVIASGPVAVPDGSYTRPSSPVANQEEFDRALGIPIWYSGTAWVNFSGAAI